jgi:hypothetical protein
MAISILFNASNGYSRFRLWRIDANREMLESCLKALTGLGSAPDMSKRSRQRRSPRRRRIERRPKTSLRTSRRFAFAVRSSCAPSSRLWAARCSIGIRIPRSRTPRRCLRTCFGGRAEAKRFERFAHLKHRVRTERLYRGSPRPLPKTLLHWSACSNSRPSIPRRHHLLRGSQ